MSKISAADQAKIDTLQELFPDWTADDLLEPIKEYNDLETIIENISTGKITKWDEVKKLTRKEKKEHAAVIRNQELQQLAKSTEDSKGTAATGVTASSTSRHAATAPSTKTNTNIKQQHSNKKVNTHTSGASTIEKKKNNVDDQKIETNEKTIEKIVAKSTIPTTGKKMSWASIATPKNKPEPKKPVEKKESPLENVETLKNEIDNIQTTKDMKNNDNVVEEVVSETIIEKKSPVHETSAPAHTTASTTVTSASVTETAPASTLTSVPVSVQPNTSGSTATTEPTAQDPYAQYTAQQQQQQAAMAQQYYMYQQQFPGYSYPGMFDNQYGYSQQQYAQYQQYPQYQQQYSQGEQTEGTTSSAGYDQSGNAEYSQYNNATTPQGTAATTSAADASQQQQQQQAYMPYYGGHYGYQQSFPYGQPQYSNNMYQQQQLPQQTEQGKEQRDSTSSQQSEEQDNLSQQQQYQQYYQMQQQQQGNGYSNYDYQQQSNSRGYY
ncbi:RNAPII degradation factor [Maudiozyma exigua]|uniref:RNA polymerase II degradation factor 1 n=1 Tax=Maudiozyma exigua TaxID=34358 RepID=A0A9P6W0S3_MAUEX|nr:RNAPII degradation factor [Kazachstania exigua]